MSCRTVSGASMQAALLKVSEAPIDQPPDIQVKLWARDVKELSYDVEDTIDAFMVRVGTCAPKKLHGLRDFNNRSLNLLTKANVRHKIGTDIKHIKRRIMELYTKRRLSSWALKTQEKSHGLIKRLMEGEEASKQQLKIVSIIGFGGLGKTTLANIVYEKLKEQFDCSAFISVSLNPNMEKIFKNMLHQLGKPSNIDDEAQLINELRDFLRNRRFKSDEKTLADSLDYEKVETKKLREDKEDLLKKVQEANSAAQKLQEEINKKETEIGRLKDKDQERSLLFNETARIAKENAEEIRTWERLYNEAVASHKEEVEKLDSRLVEQVVENKRLLVASTCNQKEMLSTKISLQDNIALLNNVLGELRAEGKTPQEDTIAAHTSTIGEQIGTLQELVNTMKANQTDSIKEAVEGAVSYAVAKLKAHDPNLNVQPIEVDFICPEAEASQLIEEMRSIGKKVSEEMRLGSPSSE